MQLVAYGAQDLYLTSDPSVTFFKTIYMHHQRQPETLQQYALQKLTEKQITFLFTLREQYPDYVEYFDKERKDKYSWIIRDFASRIKYHYNTRHKVFSKVRNYIKISEKRANTTQKTIRKLFWISRLREAQMCVRQQRNDRMQQLDDDETYEMNDLF